MLDTNTARWRSAAVLICIFLASCGESESIVEPGPGESETETETSTSEAPTELETVETTTSLAPTSTNVPESSEVVETTTTFVVIENSENAVAYTELAASGLAMSIGEQTCADERTTSEIDAGLERLDALVVAIQSCAAPAVVDEFSAGLLSAGGAPLPPTEAACVAGRLRSDESYRPFWAALLSESEFDYLASSIEVQDLYIGLFAECVSVGRALASQVGDVLSEPSIACIDGLYDDAEFVRVTIEADLSGDATEVARIDSQIQSCLTSEEREALGLS